MQDTKYCYPDTDILINKLDIRDLDKLHIFERKLTMLRLLELLDKPINGKNIENILSSCTIKPMVNQLLAHIGNTPANLIEYCRENGILVEAYSPVAHGEILKSEEVRAIAEKYQVTVPQLCIRYDLQLGTLPLPKTANPAHMLENAKVDFEISEQDMEILKSIKPLKDYGEYSSFPVFSGK